MIYQRFGKIIVAVIGLMAVFMLYQVVQLEYDYDFEKFFPVNDENTDFFLEHRDQFGTDNDYVLIGLENESGVFQYDFLKKVDSLTRGIEQLNEVKQVLSPTNLLEYRRYQMHPALIELPYLHWEDTSRYARDSARIFSTPELSNTFFSTEHPAVVLFIEHTSGLQEDKCQILAKELDSLGRSYEFDHIHFAGRSYGQSIYIDLIRNETALFVTSSVLLVILFLIIAYRSFWGFGCLFL
ncbi:hypothetical protein KFE98_18150 [bacterium SCSIO 12741]|nr:hypothetical protein KFE98_18150 [bacterium SCSIO 12741]